MNCGEGLSLPLSLSVVIPTYRREKVLLNTISALCKSEPQAAELIVVDQTRDHERETINQLLDWESRGVIKRLVLVEPSITAAMNTGLISARTDLVLFLDDDILPHHGLIEGHCKAHTADPSLWATVGQVVQPWQRPEPVQPPRKTRGLMKDFDFPFLKAYGNQLIL